MMERGGRDDEIRLRESMPRFSARFDEQAPLEHNVFTNCDYSLFKHRPQFIGQPPCEFGALMWIAQQLDTKTYLSKRDGADE